MSFSGIRDIFMGRLGANYCVKAVLFLKSPDNVKEYLTGIHKVVFPDGDTSKREKWRAYTRIKGRPPVTPISQKHLKNTKFMNKQADKLSFDISRFTEFLSGYAKVDDDIKPVTLYYAMIYLFDFYSRTWLEYPRNWGHGITAIPTANELSAYEYPMKIQKNGIFPRAVDAFYFSGQSSLFSADEDDGIPYHKFTDLEIPFPKIEKIRYSEQPKIKLAHLIDVYERLDRIKPHVLPSNPILVGYAILFILSFISRYRADLWFKIRENRNLINTFEFLQYDFLYEWTPEILMQTILRKDLKKELSLPGE